MADQFPLLTASPDCLLSPDVCARVRRTVAVHARGPQGPAGGTGPDRTPGRGCRDRDLPWLRCEAPSRRSKPGGEVLLSGLRGGPGGGGRGARRRGLTARRYQAAGGSGSVVGM